MINRVVPVGSIKVANRIRKEFGDITSLANDIKENGLLNPVTLTPDGKLLAGERRLRAVKSLGWENVDARIVEDPDDMKQLSIEISENDNRKEFTFSERREYIGLLHKMFDAEAKKRQLASLNNSGNASLASHDANEKTSKRIGDVLGVSSTTIERAEYVADHATPEMIAALDAEQLSINAAYKQLKEQAKKAEEENRSLAKELAEAQEDARREKAAKNQLEREEDEASDKMERLNMRIFDLQDKIAVTLFSSLLSRSVLWKSLFSNYPLQNIVFVVIYVSRRGWVTLLRLRGCVAARLRLYFFRFCARFSLFRCLYSVWRCATRGCKSFLVFMQPFVFFVA